MRLTASKKKRSIQIKKRVGLFIFLFVASVVLLFEHFNEGPFQLDKIKALNDSNSVFMAPDFTLINLKGNREGLGDYRGNVLLLNLWATWCVPCRIEMKSFETLYRRYRSQGLTILAVSIDKNSLDKVKRFVEERQLSFPVLIDKNQKVEKLYPSPTIPATFVINRKGFLVTKVDGAKNWETEETFKAIEFLLKDSE